MPESSERGMSLHRFGDYRPQRQLVQMFAYSIANPWDFVGEDQLGDDRLRIRWRLLGLTLSLMERANSSSFEAGALLFALLRVLHSNMENMETYGDKEMDGFVDVGRDVHPVDEILSLLNSHLSELTKWLKNN